MNEAYRLIQMMMIQSKPSTDDEENLVDAFFKVLKRLVFPNITSFSIVIDGLLKNNQLDLALSRGGSEIFFRCGRNLLQWK
jgi:hypothetical protein